MVDQSDRAVVARIEDWATSATPALVYSPDERFAYVFGRDGGLTKVDIVTRKIAKRIVQAGNSIGGAISTMDALWPYELRARRRARV